MATSLGETASVAAPPRHPERFWNLPNTITVLRTAVVPMLLVFPFFDGERASRVMAWAFVAAAIGDWLDGWLARRGGQITKIGKLLDPLADKLTVATALVVLMTVGRLPEWAYLLVVVIIGRELAVTGLRGIASAGGQIVAATGWGKTKTLAQNLAIVCLLFPAYSFGVPNHGMGVVLLTVATALTLGSGYAYFADYFRGERAAQRAAEENAS